MYRQRIQKEAVEAARLKEDKGFFLFVDQNSIFNWTAFLFGPDDSAYKDGIFEVKIRLDENYPLTAPKMNFVTKIFHPNIHFETGEICIEFLKDQWSPMWTLEAICRAINVLLSTPNADNPLNCDCGNLIRNKDMEGFYSMAKMYVNEYAINKKDFKIQ